MYFLTYEYFYWPLEQFKFQRQLFHSIKLRHCFQCTILMHNFIHHSSRMRTLKSAPGWCSNAKAWLHKRLLPSFFLSLLNKLEAVSCTTDTLELSGITSSRSTASSTLRVDRTSPGEFQRSSLTVIHGVCLAVVYLPPSGVDEWYHPLNHLPG